MKTNILLFIGFLFCCQLFAQSNGRSYYNILDFGAKKDTTFLSTSAINNAIEECCKNGGGTVVVPPGKYKTGTVLLKDNVELYMEPGSYLCASTNPVDIPRQPQPEYRSEKEQGGWYALIYAEKANNISITGYGIIDGQGASHKSRPECLWGDQDGRPRNILLISCKNVNISGISMYSAGLWNQHYLNCEDVRVNNIKVINHVNSNNDGINIDGCRRFILSDSNIDSDDDGIVLKSTGMAPCEDIVITNCIVSSHANAIKTGTESTGGFRNIAITNCVIKPSRIETRIFPTTLKKGIVGISLAVVDGGIMEGITINNIMIEGTECPLYIRLGNRARKHIKEAPVPPVGKVRKIQISNVFAYGTGNFSASITGIPDAKIEDVYLSNIRFFNKGGLSEGEYIDSCEKVIEDIDGYPQPTIWGNLPSYGLFIRHVKNISVHHATFQPENLDPRIPVIAIDVDDLQLKDIRWGESTEEPGFFLKDVRKQDIDDKHL